VDLRFVAEQCVSLVDSEFSEQLDWSLDSLGTLDSVCTALLADGPLPEARLDLWWKLIGAYTGEVLIGAYGGSWSEDAGTPAVMIKGHTAMPFTIANRVLSGEPYKSLASFARVFPALLARSEQA
jgi:hypothetical protein